MTGNSSHAPFLGLAKTHAISNEGIGGEGGNKVTYKTKNIFPIIYNGLCSSGGSSSSMQDNNAGLYRTD
jgi:hypothetical protein